MKCSIPLSLSLRSMGEPEQADLILGFIYPVHRPTLHQREETSLPKPHGRASRIPFRPPVGRLVVLDQAHRPIPTGSRCGEWKEEVEAALRTLQDKEEAFQTCSSRICSTIHQGQLQSSHSSSSPPRSSPSYAKQHPPPGNQKNTSRASPLTSSSQPQRTLTRSTMLT